MKNLNKLLCSKSNDYSSLEERFNQITGEKLVRPEPRHKLRNLRIKKRHSVIIPSYKFQRYLWELLLSLDHQRHDQKFEVVIVNDSAGQVQDRIRFFKSKTFDLKILNLGKNFGSAFARNAGLACAVGEIITFVDSDMVLPCYFIQESNLRLSLLPNIALVGFYQNVKPSEYEQKVKEVKKSKYLFNADFNTDSRCRMVFTEKDFRRGYNLKKENIGKEYCILRATNNFKSFGFGRKYGVWTLPLMVMAGLLTVSKDVALSVGGFDTRFRGWGFEDTHFGAKLIAYGVYIVPSYACVAYRVKHGVRRGTLAEKTKESRVNLSLYKNLLRESFDTATPPLPS
jgi:glycosyltransferase involved in cell wall biosynthesis